MGIEVVILIACVVLFGMTYGTYTGLIKAKNKVQEAFSSIDVQLKKRYDLIPNILTIAKKFMEHEKGLLEELTKLRTDAMNLSNKLSDSGKKFELDNLINGKLGQIMVAVENYPQLKSDATMVQAMQSYNDVEEHIAAARRFYNSAVLVLNNKVEIFPSSLVALMIGVGKQEFFEAQEVERKGINAADYLK